jgi:hypothetical protein
MISYSIFIFIPIIWCSDDIYGKRRERRKKFKNGLDEFLVDLEDANTLGQQSFWWFLVYPTGEQTVIPV